MKWLCLLLTIGIFGCVAAPPAVTVVPTSTPMATAAPVRPEQVTPQTAHGVSQALADELDRETQHEITRTKQ
jgi:hypothetical protein